VSATLLLALLAVAPATPPPEPPPLVSGNGQNWSVVGARTTGQGGNLIEGGIGWPGIHLSYLRGLTPKFDIGVRATFNFGYEGQVTNALPGVKGQLLLHYKVYDSNTLSLALTFEPGPFDYFAPNGCFFDAFGRRVCNTNALPGFTFPFGLHLGIAASSAVNIGVTFDVPVWLNFGVVNGAQLPVLFGAGLEYFIRSNLLLYGTVKMGPTVYTNGASAVFTFDAKFGVGVRF
jgi:hypothetical protein